MSRIIDISLPYSEALPAWPGEPKPALEFLEQISEGGVANVTKLTACVHFGTHMDAPMHFVDGAGGIDGIDLNKLVGPACVVDMRGIKEITSIELKRAEIPADAKRILFRTDNSELWNDLGHEFYEDFVAITPDGASWLVDRGVVFVGIDYLSIETYHTTDFATHKTILGAGIAVVEGLDLRNVAPGEYQLVCLPVKLADRDGAPARAILIDEKESA